MSRQIRVVPGSVEDKIASQYLYKSSSGTYVVRAREEINAYVNNPALAWVLRRHR